MKLKDILEQVASAGVLLLSGSQWEPAAVTLKQMADDLGDTDREIADAAEFVDLAATYLEKVYPRDTADFELAKKVVHAVAEFIIAERDGAKTVTATPAPTPAPEPPPTPAAPENP